MLTNFSRGDGLMREHKLLIVLALLCWGFLSDAPISFASQQDGATDLDAEFLHWERRCLANANVQGDGEACAEASSMARLPGTSFHSERRARNLAEIGCELGSPKSCMYVGLDSFQVRLDYEDGFERIALGCEAEPQLCELGVALILAYRLELNSSQTEAGQALILRATFSTFS